MAAHTLFDVLSPHPEASSLVAFAGNRLDRQSEHRTDDCVELALKNEKVHCFAFARGKLVMKHEEQVLDPLFAPYELRDLDPDFDNAILLGYEENGEPRVAVPVGIDPETAFDHLKFADGRTLMREALLSDSLLGEFAQASALISWNRSARYCGRCGGETRLGSGGYKRTCNNCGTEHFPRTDPVVIMLAVDVDGDRCLLGRSPHFPEGMYSCLAGFVEPGETIENAVRRETFEEAGIELGSVRYHASQPWPMPFSLMIGCYGRAETFDIARDTAELEDCRWFTRDEVKAMIAGESPEDIFVPVSGAVAYRLIQDWIDWPEGREEL
ncbi:NAD(+) diphosphatase [Rhizobium alvei]|uniref:NAD(+) diphosphatase n=1 Tax=Rhizobium alvei TaxID=1132659 RepID=A0ABT8YF67_9HYPH|nr:NAD(+) diphosphatase [Rhizobium alvei]MDO6962371.1 NAD(+) diphosphatase [Rhizobium alvei]